MARKRLTEEQIRNILQTTSYSDSEGDEFENASGEEFIPLSSSSDESEEEPTPEGNYHNLFILVLLWICDYSKYLFYH